MKKILMLATGGTIASKDSGQGLTPAITSQEILNYVPAIGQLCQVEAIQLMNLDSTNITPRHWQEMARAVEEHYDQYDGFVITHGTDTMAYTAAALSYLIQYSENPSSSPVLRSPSVWRTPTPGSTCTTAFFTPRRRAPTV